MATGWPANNFKEKMYSESQSKNKVNRDTHNIFNECFVTHSKNSIFV